GPATPASRRSRSPIRTAALCIPESPELASEHIRPAQPCRHSISTIFTPNGSILSTSAAGSCHRKMLCSFPSPWSSLTNSHALGSGVALWKVTSNRSPASATLPSSLFLVVATTSTFLVRIAATRLHEAPAACAQSDSILTSSFALLHLSLARTTSRYARRCV